MLDLDNTYLWYLAGWRSRMWASPRPPFLLAIWCTHWLISHLHRHAKTHLKQNRTYALYSFQSLQLQELNSLRYSSSNNEPHACPFPGKLLVLPMPQNEEYLQTFWLLRTPKELTTANLKKNPIVTIVENGPSMWYKNYMKSARMVVSRASRWAQFRKP